jgi:threonylcarbamoyladenosine tRNA methylthiotransferase CDKAL1
MSMLFRCTVKKPSQSAMETLIRKGKDAGKPLVVAGCVPQGSKDLKDLEGVSIVGVQQIDRVVEVVEETLKGHEVRLLQRSSLPSLDLPKVRAIIDSPPTSFIVRHATIVDR